MQAIIHRLKESEMLNEEIKSNDVNVIGSFCVECVAPGMHGMPDLVLAGRDQAKDQKKERMKWEKAVKKIAIECWIRNEPTKGNIGNM